MQGLSTGPDICEHLSKWQLKRNSRAFHMATQAWAGSQAWICRLLLELAGRGPFYPGAAEPVQLQEGIIQGVPQPIVSSVSLSSRQMAGDTLLQ